MAEKIKQLIEEGIGINVAIEDRKIKAKKEKEK